MEYRTQQVKWLKLHYYRIEHPTFGNVWVENFSKQIFGCKSISTLHIQNNNYYDTNNIIIIGI